jgi:ankyrin repeat protein
MNFKKILLLIFLLHASCIFSMTFHEISISRSPQRALELQFIKDIRKGWIEKVKEKIKGGMSVNVTDEFGYCALFHSLCSPHKHITSLLLEDDTIDVNHRRDDKSLLMLAVCAKKFITASQLLRNPHVDLNVMDENKHNVLWHAIDRHFPNMIRKLLAHTSKVKDQKEKEYSISTQTVQDTLKVCKFDWTHIVVHDALDQRMEDKIIREYSDAFKKVTSEEKKETLRIAHQEALDLDLADAISCRDMVQIEELTQHGANINNRDVLREFRESASCDIEMAKLWIKHAQNINSKDIERETVLTKAAKDGKIDIVKLLLAVDGIEVTSARDFFDLVKEPRAYKGEDLEKWYCDLRRGLRLFDWQALHWATFNGHTDIGELLLKHQFKKDDKLIDTFSKKEANYTLLWVLNTIYDNPNLTQEEQTTRFEKIKNLMQKMLAVQVQIKKEA